MKMIERMRMGEKVVFTASFPHHKHVIFSGNNKTSEIVRGMKSILADIYFKMEQVISNFSYPEGKMEEERGQLREREK